MLFLSFKLNNTKKKAQRQGKIYSIQFRLHKTNLDKNCHILEELMELSNRRLQLQNHFMLGTNDMQLCIDFFSTYKVKSALKGKMSSNNCVLSEFLKFIALTSVLNCLHEDLFVVHKRLLNSLV